MKNRIAGISIFLALISAFSGVGAPQAMAQYYQPFTEYYPMNGNRAVAAAGVHEQSADRTHRRGGFHLVRAVKHIVGFTTRAPRGLWM